MIILKLKLKKKTGSLLCSKNTFLEKRGGECQTEPPILLWIKTLASLDLIRLVRSFLNC